MIDFSLTDEQQLLMDSLQEWLDANVDDASVHRWYYEDHAVPAEIGRSYVEAGFGFLGIPEEFGGTPVDTLTLGLVVEKLAHHFACLVPFPAATLGMYDLISFGRPEQISAMMTIFRESGQAPFSVVMSEPGAGSDSMAITTTAKEIDGKIHLNGQKTWVTLGGLSPWMLVIARDEDPAADTASLWLMPRDTPGVTLSPISKMGTNLMPFYDIFFDDVVIDPSCLCGERGKGFLHVMKNFEMERTLILAQNVGVAQAAMDDAAAYVSTRTTWGKPIASYQLIQEKLTDMQIKINNMRWSLYHTLWMIDQGQSVRLDSALLKRYGPMASTEVCDQAMQIYGGLGYTHETRVSRAMLDCRGTQFGGGTNEIMVHIAGRLLAKQYARG